MNEPKNILIVRTDRIGDLILTLPAAAVLKKHFPGCRVSFLIREYTKELALNNPFIDEVLVLREKQGKPEFFSNLNMISERKFDTVVTVFPRFRIALILFYAGIKTRIGTGYRWYSFLFNKKVYEHRKYGEKHELVHNINLLKPLGINEEVTEDNCVYGLSPAKGSKDLVETFLIENRINLTRPAIIFHPGSGGSAVDLPIEKMKLLVSRCADELDAEIIITGDKREEEICSSFPARGNIYNLCGKFNLGELTALIDNSAILVANSTGPLHIAAALGKHVIGFFPKIRTMSPVRWAPFTTRKNIFVPPVNCTDCTRKQCAELDCMNHISTDEIFEAIKKVANNAGN